MLRCRGSARDVEKINMPTRKTSLIVSAILAAILCAGTLGYGLTWGVPQWSSVFQGRLAPVIGAYGGWSISIGLVTVGVILVGGCLALSWMRASYDYLVLSIGVVAVLVFVALGLPAQDRMLVDATLSFVMVGLCALLVGGVFVSALKDRFTRRYRV